MRSRYRMVEAEQIYFLTSTIVEWIPALTGKEEADLLIASLAYCRCTKGLRIYAYVIMDNHIHLVAAAPDLARVFQAFKRHTARQLVALCERRGRTWLLNQFAYYKKQYKTESRYQVWQEGFHPQLIADDNMLHQKIEYIHNNPLLRGWVDMPEHWRYSSARNYVLEDHSVLEIDLLPL